MDTASVRKSVEEGNRKFGAAVERKNYSEIAALYTDDAKVLPPDAPIVSGKGAIETFWKEAAASLGLNAAKLTTIDLEVAGDTAYEVGEAVLTLSSGQAPRLKYIVVWRKGSDEAWRLHRDIWNNMPAA